MRIVAWAAEAAAAVCLVLLIGLLAGWVWALLPATVILVLVALAAEGAGRPKDAA